MTAGSTVLPADPRRLCRGRLDPHHRRRRNHFELVGISSGVTASTADFTVTAAPATVVTNGTLPVTGWSPGLLLAAAALLAAGGGLLLGSGQIARSVSAQYRSRSSRV